MLAMLGTAPAAAPGSVPLSGGGGGDGEGSGGGGGGGVLGGVPLGIGFFGIFLAALGAGQALGLLAP